MGPAGAGYKTLQIHPTRLCNLTCLHCYSSSGPSHRGHLELDLLRAAVSEAAAEGYNNLAVSGGEPLLYPGLPELLSHARHHGWLTTLTTNGTLLKGDRLARLEGVVDLIAVSLDGTPASHDRMRNAPDAFARMAANLEGLRRSAIPFGFIFTLTQRNLGELRWVTSFALEQGAALLQIHPLETLGRAAADPGRRPDEVEAAFAYLEALRTQHHVGDRLAIRIDLMDRGMIAPVAADASCESAAARSTRPLAELVSPLVIEPDADVVPLQYGFGRPYRLGNLRATSFAAMAAAWKADTYPAFDALRARVVRDPRGDDELPIFNWYEEMLRFSLEPTVAAPQPA